MSRKNNPLLVFALVCIAIGLLAALLPFSDIDNDGLLDSIVTEGLLLLPALLGVTASFLLLDRLSAASLAAPRPCASPLFLPPIFN